MLSYYRTIKLLLRLQRSLTSLSHSMGKLLMPHACRVEVRQRAFSLAVRHYELLGSLNEQLEYMNE